MYLDDADRSFGEHNSRFSPQHWMRKDRRSPQKHHDVRAPPAAGGGHLRLRPSWSGPSLEANDGGDNNGSQAKRLRVAADGCGGDGSSGAGKGDEYSGAEVAVEPAVGRCVVFRSDLWHAVDTITWGRRRTLVRSTLHNSLALVLIALVTRSSLLSDSGPRLPQAVWLTRDAKFCEDLSLVGESAHACGIGVDEASAFDLKVA